MSNNVEARISTAHSELSKAQAQLTEKDIDSLLKGIRNELNAVSTIEGNFLDKVFKKGSAANFLSNGALFLATQSGYQYIDANMGESQWKRALGMLADGATTILLATPQGRLLKYGLQGANFVASLAGYDAASGYKKLYDLVTGNDDTDPNAPKISITNGYLKVTIPDGTVYARPLIDKYHGGLITGGSKNDVLFGGKGDDRLRGDYGSDILIGGAGKDDYMIDYSDTIRDSDGKGRVFLYNNLLTGDTQTEPGSKIYHGKDGVKYELKGSDLIINDNATIENFSNDDLGIHLSEFDEIKTLKNVA